ncbi:MAG: hypothetical protein ABIG95_05845 [Candidatus Woesearchaeota archaeon]
MLKKGDFEWTKIAELLLAVAVLLALIAVLYFLRDKAGVIWQKIAGILRFS